ncbi:MAG: hypothetical protein ACJ78Q_04655, partial [Chloroflexia bacterium]
VNFEVRLYENDRTFDIIYRAVPGGGSGATVGAETYDRGRYTQYQCDTGRLSPGLLLNFSLPTCPPEPTATPITYDSFAHLEPAAATPLVVGVNSKFTLDLLINSGDSGLNIASAQQSYLTFTYTLLKNVRADSAGCIASNTVTAITDAGFETELQNNACNGPGPCPGPNAPAGSIAFASGSYINPGVSGDFPVARMAFCGTAPGTAIIHWQFAPTAPITRESEVVGPDSLPVSNPALYNGGNGDYIVQIVGPTSTPTFTRTSTRTPTQTATPTSTTPTATPVRSIRGHLVWQGRPPQPNPLQQLPLTITLRLQGGGPATELTGLTTDASGTFIADVTSVPGGDYDLRLKGPQFLATSGTVILPGVPVVTNLEMYEQRSGDCDNNNVVSWSDFFILRSSFGMDSHSPMYDGRADLDGDLRVGFGDFSLLVSNFNRWGAEPLSGNLPR